METEPMILDETFNHLTFYNNGLIKTLTMSYEKDRNTAFILLIIFITIAVVIMKTMGY